MRPFISRLSSLPIALVLFIAIALPAVVVLGAPGVGIARVMAPGGPPDTLEADVRASIVSWKGGRHTGAAASHGAARLTSGMLVIRHEMLVGGRFVVGASPVSVFVARDAERVGPARWRVSGDLERNGATRPLTFDTDVAWAGLGHMVATATFPLDDTTRVSVKLEARRRNPRVAARF